MHDLIRNHYQLRALMEETINLDGRGEVYTFMPSANPSGFAFIYLIPQTLAYCEAQSREPYGVHVDEGAAMKLAEARSISPGMAMAVVGEREKQGTAYTPALIVDWGDGTKVVIDGNHRFIASGLRGAGIFQAHLIPQEEMLRQGLCRRMTRQVYNQINEAA